MEAPDFSGTRRNVAVAVRDAKIFRFAAAAIIASLVIAALALGRPLLVPIALAILFAFALSPVTALLTRIGMPRPASVVLSVLTAVGIAVGLAVFIGGQMVPLMQDLPNYQKNITIKVASISGSASSSAVLRNVEGMLQGFNVAITGNQPSARGVPARLSSTRAKVLPQPVPVEIKQPGIAPLEVINSVVDWLFEPLVSAAVIMIFVIFLLLQKDDLRDRFITLAGGRDIQRTATALDDGASRLSSYLLLQTGVNVAFGFIIFAGLWAIGVPTPGLWGLVGGLLRFVPYVGVPISAILPLLLSLSVDAGWTMVALTATLYGVVEVTIGQAVEPWLYGRRMGLSPTAVILSAGFWTLVWGPIGLLLSTPLTMCLVVLGRHAEGMQFLEVLLGDKATLTPEESFYLRMLAGNFDEMVDLAELQLKSGSLNELFEIIVRALSLAQIDLDRGTLDREQAKEILDSTKLFLGNFEERLEPQDEVKQAAGNGNDVSAKSVLCVAGRGPLDEAVSLLLAALLKAKNIPARALSADQASPARIDSIDISEVRAVCLTYLRPGNSKSPQFMERRWRKRAPLLPVLVSFWGTAGDDLESLESFMHEPHEYVTRNFEECLGILTR
jgi:predicted PurR-regulated permease PerM